MHLIRSIDHLSGVRSERTAIEATSEFLIFKLFTKLAQDRTIDS